MGVYSGPNSEEDGLVLAIDVGNKKSFSPNVFPRGTDIYGWYVDTKGDANAANSTLSRDTISSPVGNTPLKMAVTNNDPHITSYNSSIWNLANAASGETWTISVYVKASQSTTGELLIFGANSGGTYVEIPNTTVNISTSWTRVSYTGTFSNANTAFLQMRLDGPQSGGTGINVWWDGLQIERGSTATEFTKEYTLDSSFNERTLDLSGNGRNATVNGGPTFTNGYFDITSDSTYISLSNSGLVPRTNDFTYSTWINFDATDNVDTIFENGSWADTLLFRYQSSSSGVRVYAEGALRGTFSWTPSTGVWYNVVFKRLSGTCSMYINNTLTGTPFTMTTDINLANTNLFLMRSQHTTNQFTNGKIATFSIYSRALTASEIQRNFIALRGRFGI